MAPILCDHGRAMEKAYKNSEFLMGREARPLRILSEYLEPQARFARYKVSDTVVFFGSARALPVERAEEALVNAKSTGNPAAKRRTVGSRSKATTFAPVARIARE